MTCYEMGIMIHYYTTPLDHPDIERNPPIWRPTITAFLDTDLLQLRDQAEPEEIRTAESCYVITDRGRAYVERLRTIGLPEQSWGYAL